MHAPTRNCSRWLAKCPTQQEVDQLKTRVSDLRKRGKGRWQRPDSFCPPQTRGNAPGDVRFVVMLLEEPERRAVYEANIAQIPGLRRLAAIDASAQDRFWRDFEEQQVRFADSVLMDTRSVGQVALTLSRIHALRWQVRQNVSWMCMMEDDVAVSPGFVERVEALADSLSPAVRQGLLRVVRLGKFGELYLVPQGGARAILCRYCQSGMTLASDNQLRLLSGPECATRLDSLYSLKAAPDHGHNEDVTERAISRNQSAAFDPRLTHISDAFRERARQLGRTFPAQPHWCRSLGKTCRWGVPLDGVSQVMFDEWRESQCLRFGQDHFSCSRRCQAMTSGGTDRHAQHVQHALALLRGAAPPRPLPYRPHPAPL